MHHSRGRVRFLGAVRTHRNVLKQFAPDGAIGGLQTDRQRRVRCGRPRCLRTFGRNAVAAFVHHVGRVDAASFVHLSTQSAFQLDALAQRSRHGRTHELGQLLITLSIDACVDSSKFGRADDVHVRPLFSFVVLRLGFHFSLRRLAVCLPHGRVQRPSRLQRPFLRRAETKVLIALLRLRLVTVSIRRTSRHKTRRRRVSRALVELLRRRRRRRVRARGVLLPIRDAPRHRSRIRHSSTLSIARRRDRTARSASSTASGRSASTRPLRRLRLRLFLALDRLERGEQSDLLLAKVFRRRFERVRRREGELRARTRGNCRQSPISLKSQISCRSRRRARTVDTSAVTAVTPYRYARESSSPPIAARESRAREEWWRFLESVTAGDAAGRRRERRRRDEGLRRLRILSSYGWSSTIYVN